MAEYWDLYDLHGNLTDEKYRRDSDDPFPLDKYHIVVEIYTVHRGCLLMTKRDERKPFGGLWEFTGGSVIAGENSRTGASRELAEETGIIQNGENLIHLFSRLNGDGKMNWVYDSYLAVIPDSDPRPTVVYQEGETVDHIWLNRKTAEEFMSSPAFVKHVAKRYYLLSDAIWNFAELSSL